MLKSINPYTNELIKEHDVDTDEIITKKIDILRSSYNKWKSSSFETRSNVLKKLATSLIKEKERLALVITEEMGKPIQESVAEIEKCAWVCEYYAENGETFLKDRIIKTDAAQNKVIYQPLGIILAIMPWNFPFWQVFRFIAPNLMAGNIGCLKHASNVQGCAKEIISVINCSHDFPLIENLSIPSSKVEAIISNPNIKGITLTGSEHAGISVAQSAGKVMKKCVFELGGTDAFVVLKDADIDRVVENAILGRFLNAGQSCIAAKRFIVDEDIYDEFLLKFKTEVKELNVGDPLNKNIQIGPLAKCEFVDDLSMQVKKCIEEGGKVELGGSSDGNLFQPTIISNLSENSIANKEEFFGPVALVFKVKNEDEAIRFANSTNYGLSSSVWTSNTEKIEKFSKEIEAGAVFINQFSKSDPRLPFGGIKLSGYGRELGEEGIKEFINIKTISIA